MGTPYVGGAPPSHHGLSRVDTSLLPQRAAGASPPSVGTVSSSSHVTSLQGRPLKKYEALLLKFPNSLDRERTQNPSRREEEGKIPAQPRDQGTTGICTSKRE